MGPLVNDAPAITATTTAATVISPLRLIGSLRAPRIIRSEAAHEGRGLRARKVVEHLEISAHTVRDHLKSIYRKLDVSSRAEAAIEAQKRNLA